LLKRDSRLWYIVPPLLAGALMMTVYFLNGIFPFGDGSIVYHDMGQGNLPMYYSAWDVLHGGGSFLFNWNTAGGIFASNSLTVLLSPVNVIFLLLCPRSSILENMSFFVMLKIMIAAFTAMVFFSKKFKISAYWKVIFSILYAFNAYVLQYYTNNSWLELVAAFPLILLALDTLFTRRKIAPYVLILSYCLITQLYISYMIYIYLFLVGGLYILMLIPKETQKTAIWNFGLGSVLALLLSAASAAPTYFSMTASSRFQSARNYFQIVSTSTANVWSKRGMLVILTALPLAIFLLSLLKFRSEKRKLGFALLAVLVCALPVFFENINLIWHMGTYVNFSMRFAFMFHFTLLAAACFALERFGGSLFFGGKKLSIAAGVFVPALLIPLAAYGMYARLYSDESVHSMIEKANSGVFLIIFAAFLVSYLALMRCGAKKLACVLIAVVAVFETGFFVDRAFSHGKPRVAEFSLDFVGDCDLIYEELSLPRDNLSRVKNIDSSLNTNYPLLLNYPSMSNFTHIIPATIKLSMGKIGYSNVYTRILDPGGTLFSDALLGIRHVLSKNAIVGNDAYRFMGEVGGYSLYECGYKMPFGVVASPEITRPDIFGQNVFETNNNIAAALTGLDGPLFEFPEAQRDDSGGSITYTFRVDERSELYAIFSAMKRRKGIRVYVNGDPVPVPSLGDQMNTRYSATFNNGILNLGTFEDEDVLVKIELIDRELTPDNLRARFALLPRDRLAALCESQAGRTTATAGKRSLSAAAYSESGGGVLFLPVVYDEGWSCTVNGKPAEVREALGTFIAVELERGENQVELRFFPQGMKIGAAVSILSLLALIFIVLYNKVKNVDPNRSNKFLTALRVGYFAALAVAFTVAYFVPMVYKIFMAVYDLF